MNPLFYVVVAITVIVVALIVWLLVDWAWRKFDAWRETKAMRVRNEQLNRYNIAAFRGTKSRLL
jgi:hypothetical protein